jgi:Astacin (Peptidase family M12A)
MQSQSNRNRYVTVITENITDGEKRQFEKLNSWEMTNCDTTYDYFSIIHYGQYTYGRNGMPTVITRGGKLNKII